MRVHTESSATGHLVELSGRFDAHELSLFRGLVDPLLNPVPEVRIDLADVVFVDSSALAELLRVQKEIVRLGGTLVLQDVSEPVRVILQITALEEVFTLATTETAAEATTP